MASISLSPRNRFMVSLTKLAERPRYSTYLWPIRLVNILLEYFWTSILFGELSLVNDYCRQLVDQIFNNCLIGIDCEKKTEETIYGWRNWWRLRLLWFSKLLHKRHKTVFTELICVYFICITNKPTFLALYGSNSHSWPRWYYSSNCY